MWFEDHRPIAYAEGLKSVRFWDSKVPSGPALLFGVVAWARFVDGLK